MSHYFADEAGEDCADEGAEKGNGDGVEEFFDFGLGDIDSGDIEDCFTASHDYASATGDIIVRSVGGEDVFEYSITSTSGEGAEQHEFA